MKSRLDRGGVLAAGALAAATALPASASRPPQVNAVVNGFSYGELQAQVVGQSGCGSNIAGEPSIHVSKNNLVGLGSEDGLGGGSEYWRATQVGGTTAAQGCDLVYAGQPNAVGGVGASGGDIDTAFAPKLSAAGTYRIYVASLNPGSVNVATSVDDGATFTQTPVQAGLPLDDREWIAAYGADTSLLTFHDIATNDIDVLRSDNGGALYTLVSRVIPVTDYKAMYNQLGNIAIDHRNPAPGGSFHAYQSFVAPATDPGATGDGTYKRGVSRRVGRRRAYLDRQADSVFDGLAPMASITSSRTSPSPPTAPCSTPSATTRRSTSPSRGTAATPGSARDPSAPSGAPSSRGSWPLAPVRTGLLRLERVRTGPDLVRLLRPAPPPLAVELAHLRADAGSPRRRLRGGVGCTGGRQLLDNFRVDTDQSGWAHIAYSHDAPDLGGSGTYTGYAVQQAGRHVGYPN